MKVAFEWWLDVITTAGAAAGRIPVFRDLVSWKN
jgi:hypothetical protein